ncbi:MAG: hypothetical protein LAT80_02310 [Balneolaceae bacterium]|nr:hypothetical protein [Balneolaceae bacterium]MCH8547678.1 hypothetical protein [Balneolaceae bacterium]
MTPDWIPNIHPFVVHFPIALIVLAVLFDAARLFFRQHDWLEKATLALYATGSVGLIAAFLSGREAVETVSVTGDAVPVVTSHEDWALYTLIYFLVFTAIRFVNWWKQLEKGFVLPVLVVFAIGGTGMLWYTGEQGAKLVYKHGVAVVEIDRLQQQIETLERDLSAFRDEAGPELRDDGSWIWRVGPGADDILTEAFTIEGSTDLFADAGRTDGIHHLELQAGAEASYILLGEAMSSVDGRIELNTEEFEGKIALIHHYQDPSTYQYLRLSGSELSQGQMIGGSDNVLGSGQIETSGWYTLRVTASGGHYYGYRNGQTVVHTHEDELEAGRTGVMIRGEGTVRILLVEFSSI